MTGVYDMMRSSRNIVALNLRLPCNGYWDLFRAAVRFLSLSSLSISNSSVNLDAAEALGTMSCVIKSLKSLQLDWCTIDRNAHDYLVRTLSDNEVIDDLSLSFNKINPPAPYALSCGNLKVNKLDLSDMTFDGAAFSKTVDDIARNSSIKTLDIWNVLDCARAYEKVCDVFLRQNMGPSELLVNDLSSYADMVTEALQQNTSLKALTIVDVGGEGLVTFARGLANMRGLRRLAIGYQGFKEEYTKEFFHVLAQSLELNTNLWKLSLNGIRFDDKMATPYLPRIRYLLTINRVGRHSLLSAAVPLGIWAHILARCSDAADGIYFVLAEKPEIVCPGRKRKIRDEECPGFKFIS
jgi:hypothetical protein